MSGFVAKNWKKFTIVGAIFLFVTVAISLFFVIRDRIYSARIDVVIAPTIAMIDIDGTKTEAYKMHHVKPGKYLLTFFADGFVTESREIEVGDGETVKVLTFLEPTSDNADWYENNPMDATIVGDIKSDLRQKEFSDLQEENPILNYVPFYAANYQIGYEKECSGSGGLLCIIISAKHGMRDYAVEYLQSKNIKMAHYYVKLDDAEAFAFTEKTIEIPDSWRYTENAIKIEDRGALERAIESSIHDSVIDGYVGVPIQTGTIGSLVWAKVGVFLNGDDRTLRDTYRVLFGLVDGEWRAFTNMEILLNVKDNPRIPESVLERVNGF